MLGQNWQEAIGMKYMHGLSLRNYTICSRHFTDDSYLNIVTRKLRVDAVPSLYPTVRQPDVVCVEHAKVDELLEGRVLCLLYCFMYF